MDRWRRCPLRPVRPVLTPLWCSHNRHWPTRGPVSPSSDCPRLRHWERGRTSKKNVSETPLPCHWWLPRVRVWPHLSPLSCRRDCELPPGGLLAVILGLCTPSTAALSHLVSLLLCVPRFDVMDDQMVVKETIPLSCPLSMAFLKNPCRGKSCTHLSCYEFEVWIGPPRGGLRRAGGWLTAACCCDAAHWKNMPSRALTRPPPSLPPRAVRLSMCRCLFGARRTSVKYLTWCGETTNSRVPFATGRLSCPKSSSTSLFRM